MLVIWSLVPLPFLNPAWRSGNSQFMNSWSLACRILSTTLLTCEMNAIVQWFEHFLALLFFGTGMKTDLFQSYGRCWVFHICWHIECSTFIMSSFRIWNNEIPSPPLFLQIVMLLKALWTSHSGCLALSAKKPMAPHSSTLAWKIPLTEEPGRYSPWGRWGLDTTERLHFHFSLSCIGEGNGNPLQCSCLENPRDRGACWASVYGVTQSQTRLKWLSSSSSSRWDTIMVIWVINFFFV